MTYACFINLTTDNVKYGKYQRFTYFRLCDPTLQLTENDL